MLHADTLAIDFGTSNTAAAVLQDGVAHVIPLEAGADTIPTAVFLDYATRETLVGQAAVAALIAGREGRFMRALKSVLGTPLMHEKRRFLNESLTLIEVVARFLAEVRHRAEAATGRAFNRVLSGRPVHFHTKGAVADPARDAQAEADLAACYRLAGFDAVDFLAEPAAAALAAGPGGTGLIVDIGGGTSDFSLFRQTAGKTEVLASHGIRLGGTDFDRRLSLTHVMPLLGMGTGLRAELGDAVHAAPVALFHELATWAAIPFLYTAQTRREVARMTRVAVAADRFARLERVLRDELGHDIAFAVEAGKIAANRGAGQIDLGMVARGLAVPLGAGDLQRGLAAETALIAAAAGETLARAGVAPGAVARIVLVGGSSLMHAVATAAQAAVPGAAVEKAQAFTAVVAGLALATAPR